jgi:tetratricopeptide (TPR) repeat protein
MAKSAKQVQVMSPPAWLWPALLLVGLLAYLPAIDGPFIFDDLTVEPLHPDGSPPVQNLVRSSRPLFYLSLWLDRQVFGLSPMPMHVINIVLHLLNACLMMGVLKRLAGLARIGERKRGWLAAAGAGVFLLHPALTEGVSYIVSRSEVLSLFFGLAAFLVFLGAERIGAGRALAVLLLFGLAAVSKEHSFAFVPLMFLASLWFGETPLKGLKDRALVFVPLVVGGIAGAAYVFRAVGVQATAGFGVQGVTPLSYLATQCHVIWRYVLMFLLPWGMNIDHAVGFSNSFLEPLPAVGAVALLAASFAALKYRRAYPLAGFGWLAFLILLAPTSSVIPIADAMTDRRLYLSSLGLLAIGLEWLSRQPIPSVKVSAGCAAVLVILAVLAWNRNQDYTSSERLWRASVAENPANARAHFQLAHALYASGGCEASSAEYQQAYRLGQQGADLLVDWALALDCAGQADAAAGKLKEALGKNPRSFHAHSTLGMVYGKQGRLEEALAELDRAIELNRRFDMAWTYRGNILFLMGRREEAASDFKRALALRPDNPAAQKGLAATLGR